MEYERKTTRLWEPGLEWTASAGGVPGNPFDFEARVVFAHEGTGEEITTPMFYVGGDQWRFRFLGTRVGTWRFRSTSGQPGLNGLSGSVVVAPDPSARGDVGHHGNSWAWTATGRVFVPQLVMYDGPDAFYQNPRKIDRDIEVFLHQHGFSGFHVEVGCRWFDLHQRHNDQIGDTDPNPDPRTFEALELLITRVYAAGGMVHLWIWGDDDPGHNETPTRADWGGKNGRVDLRLQNTIAGRLGPLPGWSAGYGYDLEDWSENRDLVIWHQNMHRGLGWPHMLGGREGSPRQEAPRVLRIADSLDYAGYTHLRPGYSIYRAALNRHLDRPVMSEDRFRIRRHDRWAKKDYTEELTRRGLWHSFIAGGVANIWGNLLSEGDTGGTADPEGNRPSFPYRHPEWIHTCMAFFEPRFHVDLVPANELTDFREALLVTHPLTCCLRRPGNRHYLFYAEDTRTVRMDLREMPEPQRALAVETTSPYQELDLGTLGPGEHHWDAPHRSDWALAVGSW